jgi:hypothetical protein
MLKSKGFPEGKGPSGAIRCVIDPLCGAGQSHASSGRRLHGDSFLDASVIKRVNGAGKTSSNFSRKFVALALKSERTPWAIPLKPQVDAHYGHSFRAGATGGESTG